MSDRPEFKSCFSHCINQLRLTYVAVTKQKATFHEKVNMIDYSEAGIKCLERRVKNSGEVLADGDCSHEIKRRLLLGGKVKTNLDSILKKQRYYFANKGPSSQGCGFSCGHIWM